MRAVLFLLAVTLSIQAAIIEAKYDISFAVFGKIGEAYVALETDEHFYHITVQAGLSGSAASLGGHRREKHESFGFIDNGVLTPTLYKKERRSDSRNEDTYFVIDPDGTVTKYRFKEKEYEDYSFDIATGITAVTKVRKSSSVEKLPFKADNDLLSLFFNVKTLMKNMERGTHVVKTAAGAKGDKGEILITNPGGEKRQELADLMKDNKDRFVTVVVNQDIFESDKGELYINLDEDFLAKEAMLKDVLMFGDIRGKRVWQNGHLKIAGRD